ncbi:MAG: hypothetical protein GY861_09275 [bacterium]|nr:hypothetical protein [bacterium]
MAKKIEKEKSFTIKRKTLFAIAPVVVISVLLISKHQPGPLLLFLIGVSSGIVIHRSLK